MGKQSVDGLAKNTALINPEPRQSRCSELINRQWRPSRCRRSRGTKIPPKQPVGTFEVEKVENGAQALDAVNNYDAGIIITGEPVPITKF